MANKWPSLVITSIDTAEIWAVKSMNMLFSEF